MKNKNLVKCFIFILTAFILLYSSTRSVYEHFLNDKQLEKNQVVSIERIKSDYQTIELVQDMNTEEYCLLLNGVIQNTTTEAFVTHDLMVNISLELCNKFVLHDLMVNISLELCNKFVLNEILILGGGDGYPAMFALESGLNVTNVELDGTLVDFVKQNEITKKFTNNSFNNENITLIVDDAYDFIYKENKTYDIIIHDIEMETDQTKRKFIAHDTYIIDNMLTVNGILNYTDYIDYDKDSREVIDKLESIANMLVDLKINSNAKYNILVFETEDDFDYLESFFLIDTNKHKIKYKTSQIGIAYNENKASKCGNILFGGEFYLYICKNNLNMNNEAINFVNFADL